jgi:hypothetical protein
MSISILVEPTATGFRAETGSPLNLSVDAPSSELAVSALRAKIAQRLQNGAQIIQLPMPQWKSPVPIPPLSENPLWEDFLKAVKDYREQREAEEEAEEAKRAQEQEME